ncbi:hypothetical protein [Megamonas funiformis]|uniref:hypothetical protein n=1 Tax=Megamonas funiformis TaxID=437897 RepID=UPI0026DAB990|nr:hypothetical protein [Megamonas funiformis]
MEAKIKYLEMIQNVINRMAKNSFLLKGWSITLLTGIITLLNNKIYVSNSIIILFLLLDSYYLMNERQYRKLYEKARMLNNKEINFDMSIKFFDKKEYLKSIFSYTEICFYIILIIINNILLT